MKQYLLAKLSIGSSRTAKPPSYPAADAMNMETYCKFQHRFAQKATASSQRATSKLKLSEA